MPLELSTAAFLMERERASKQKLFPLPRRFAIASYDVAVKGNLQKIIC